MRKGKPVISKAKFTRRNTVDMFPQPSTSIGYESGDDVFHSPPPHKMDHPTSCNLSFNCSTSSSIFTVADHISYLFSQLETFMQTATELECIFVQRQIGKMKSSMETVNKVFDDILINGQRMEKFLAERNKNNNTGSKMECFNVNDARKSK